MRRPRAGIGQEIDLAAQHILQRGRAALVRDGVKPHAGRHGELFHAHVRRAADAGVPVCQFARVGLGVRHDFLERLEWRGGQHGNAERLARRARQVGQFATRVQLQQAKLRKARDRDGNLTDGVAVRLRLRQRLRADHS